MFIATSFTIAKMWKQSKRPPMDEWINKMWYIHTEEYYSALKEEGNLVICYNMEEPRGHYAK